MGNGETAEGGNASGREAGTSGATVQSAPDAGASIGAATVQEAAAVPQPRVLIGIPTHAGQQYCRAKFFHWLGALTSPCDVVVVTNSGAEDKKDLEEHLVRSVPTLAREGRIVEVLVNAAPIETDHKADVIIQNRNLLRERFLKGSWTHLLFLDSDVLGPLNLVEVMLKDAKPLLTGVYFSTFEVRSTGKIAVRPVVYGFDRPGLARQLTIHEVIPPRLFPVAAAGLGCCLIAREPLEKVAFHRTETGGTEDAAFFLDCRKNHGWQLWCDTRVKCLHLKFPPEDPRNALLDPRRYRIEVKKK